MSVIKSVSLFVLAGLCEIGGGYLIWLWFKEDRSIWYGISGAVFVALYGVVATYQTASFGRYMPRMAAFSSSCPSYGPGK